MKNIRIEDLLFKQDPPVQAPPSVNWEGLFAGAGMRQAEPTPVAQTPVASDPTVIAGEVAAPAAINYDEEFDYEGRKVKVAPDGQFLTKNPRGEWRPIKDTNVAGRLQSDPRVQPLFQQKPPIDPNLPDDTEFDYEGARYKVRRGSVYGVDPWTGEYEVPVKEAPEFVVGLAKRNYRKTAAERAGQVVPWLTANAMDDPDIVRQMPEYKTAYDKAYEEIMAQGKAPENVGMAGEIKNLELRMKDEPDEGRRKEMQRQATQLKTYGARTFRGPIGESYAVFPSDARVPSAEERLSAAGWGPDRIRQEADTRARQFAKAKLAEKGVARIGVNSNVTQLLKQMPAYIDWYAENRYQMDPEEAAAMDPYTIIDALEEAGKSGKRDVARQAVRALSQGIRKMSGNDHALSVEGTNAIWTPSPGVRVSQDGTFLGFDMAQDPAIPPLPAEKADKQMSMRPPSGGGGDIRTAPLTVPLGGDILPVGQVPEASQNATSLFNNPLAARQTWERGVAAVFDRPSVPTEKLAWDGGKPSTLFDAVDSYTRARVKSDPTLQNALRESLRGALTSTVVTVTGADGAKMNELALQKEADSYARSKGKQSMSVDEYVDSVVLPTWQQGLEQGKVWLPNQLFKTGTNGVAMVANTLNSTVVPEWIQRNLPTLSKLMTQKDRLRTQKPLDPGDLMYNLQNGLAPAASIITFRMMGK